MQFTVQRVTPAKAQAMLDESAASGFQNRPPSKTAIAKYASDMVNGNFHGGKTGETVKVARINRKRAIVDGQHRLHAVVASGVSVELAFAEPIDPEMFKYIDGGKPRTLSELMSIDDSPLRRRASVYASAGYMLYKEDHTGDPRVKPDADESEGWGSVLDYVREHYAQDLDDTATEYATLLSPIERMNLGAKSVMLYLAMRAKPHDADLCEKMLRYYATYGETAPPNKNFTFAARKCLSVKEKAKFDGGEGRVLPGQHQQVVNDTLLAHVLAWNNSREGHYFKSEHRFNEAFNVLAQAPKVEGWPAIN